MIKKISALVLVVLLFLTVLSPTLVQSQSGLTVTDSSAKVEFPLKLNFNARVTSVSDVTDVRLRYKIEQVTFADVTSEAIVEFKPGKTVDAKWTFDMRKIGGLPPGAKIDYWWEVKNAAGEKLETTPVPFHFNDSRYTWRNLVKDKITIFWYEGDNIFAQTLMDTSQQSLVRLANDTGAALDRPARIYLYANAKDLQGALVFPQEWTGGVAYAEHGIIAIGIAPGSLSWGKRTMTHELAHIVVFQMTVNPYNELPVWLNEGFAMYAEGDLTQDYLGYLALAIAQNKLISVRSLASPFSAYTEKSLLSYAQSYTLVEFLVKQFGAAKMLELFNTFKQGSSHDNALKKVYGFDMDGLETQWRPYLAEKYSKTK